MSNVDTALIIFAREPEVGKVKTRLLPSFSPEAVTNLYKAFICDVCQMATQVKCTQKYLYYASSDSSIEFLNQFSNNFTIRPQSGVDLGERMHNAVNELKEEGYGKVVLIGTDCLLMTSESFKEVYKQLDNHGFVLGPSLDGGFYLIGMSQPNLDIFKGIKWGGSSVLEDTLKNIEDANSSVFLLQELEDIDTLESLKSVFTKSEVLDSCEFSQQVLTNPEFKKVLLT